MFFRFVIPLVLFALQFLVYRRMVRWARAHHPGKPWILTVVRVIFVVFNLGTLGVVLFRPQLNDFPAWFLAAGVYPYFIWQAATFFLGLVFLIALIVAAPGKGAARIRASTRDGVPDLTVDLLVRPSGVPSLAWTKHVSPSKGLNWNVGRME